MSDQTKAQTELMFKILSATILPALVWVNSLSSDIAVLKSRLETAETSIERMTLDLSKTAQTTHENAIKLESISVSLQQIHSLISETRTDVRALNQRLQGVTP